MNHDPDWKLFIHFWNRLTPHQRRIIVLKARLYKFEQQFYFAVIYTTLFIISLLVPIPRRLQPRRASAQPGTATRPFSRLLRCECGAVLWAQVTPEGKYWRCSTLKKAHTYINDQTAQNVIIPQLIKELQNAKGIHIPKAQDNTPLLKKEEQDILTKQRRLLDLYEESNIDKATYNQRIQKHNDRLNAIRAQLQQTQDQQHRHTQFLSNLTQLQRAITALPKFITTADPLTVNTTLHGILESIQITKAEHRLTFHWRV